MKKIFFVFCLFFCIIVNAKDNRVGINIYSINENIKCNNINMHVVNYNYDTNELIVSEDYSDDSSNYYVINENNECNKITNNDWLSLYNSTQTYYTTTQTEYDEELEDSSFAVIKYKKKVGLVTSYILNQDKYDETQTYYEIVDNKMNKVTIVDKDNMDNYYIKVNLKNIENDKIDKNKTYYVLDSETGLFKINENDDTSVLDLYEVTSEKIEIVKTYSKSENAAARILDRYKDNDQDQIIINVIMDELYYGIFYYNSEDSLIKIRYYGDYYNQIEEFENKIFYNYDDYIIACDIYYKKYYIYDSKFNLVNYFKFDEEYYLESAYSNNNKLYFTLRNDDGEYKSYNVSCRTNKLFYVLVGFDIFIVILFIYLIIMRRKYKKEIEFYEEKRVKESLLVVKKSIKKKRKNIEKKNGK